MPLDPTAVGSTSETVQRSWTSTDALLYAVGVGAGYPEPLQELAFTTENSNGVEQQVLPTFGVIVGSGGAGSLERAGTFDRMFLVHGEQGITLHRPIPVSGTISVSGRITGIYDKGSGGVVAVEGHAVDHASGEPMMTTTASFFIRGAGGFGGDRGPSGNRNQPPERAPDHVVTVPTKPDQALLYRLSGDRNPLHADPWFAKGAGFERPILHGLCTYGFTGRALLHTLCGSDPGRFRSMEARFSKPVYPGDGLTVSMWVDGDEAVFRTSVGDTVVLDNGRCRFLPLG